MSLLQKQYIQKSRIFLLPLTGVRKDRLYKPTNTYILSPNLINKDYPQGVSLEDQTLIMVFTKDYERRERDNVARLKLNNLVGSWTKFETEVLMSNRYFTGLFEGKDEYIYTFDLSDWSSDWYSFVSGRYSEMSPEAKDLILKFRWNGLESTERQKLYCYLYPYKDECIGSFAKELNMDPDVLRHSGELCNAPSLEMETYIYDNEMQTSEGELMNESQD